MASLTGFGGLTTFGGTATGSGSSMSGATVSTNPGTATGAPDIADLNTATNELLTTVGNEEADFGQAAADTAQATGYEGEASAYGTVQAIANQNATLEEAAGNLDVYQQGLTAKQAIGTQRAGIASAGFGASGSSLSLLASSQRQAALTTAGINLQTNVNVGGFKEQGAAAGAQGAAASGAATAATAAATAATNAGNFAQTTATNEASTLATEQSLANQQNYTTNQVNPGTGPATTLNATGTATQAELNADESTATSAERMGGISAPAATPGQFAPISYTGVSLVE